MYQFKLFLKQLTNNDLNFNRNVTFFWSLLVKCGQIMDKTYKFKYEIPC